MKNLLLFTLSLLVAIAGAAASAQPIVANLTLPSETVLPGVPFDVTVTVTNDSAAQASVGLIAQFIFTLPDGTAFSPRSYGRLEPNPNPGGPTWVSLEPGESRMYYVDWSGATTPDIFHYSEFSGPGTYELKIALSASKPGEDYVGEITTNTARLTRTMMPGEDEALWRRMSATLNGRWADDSLSNSLKGPAILREILAIHPASAYYPYAVLLEKQLRQPKPPTKDDLARVVMTAERFPSSPAYPHLLLLAAEITEGFATDAGYRRDWKARAEYLAAAERLYDEAVHKIKNPALHAVAERERDSARGAIEHERSRAVSAKIQQ